MTELLPIESLSAISGSAGAVAHPSGTSAQSFGSQVEGLLGDVNQRLLVNQQDLQQLAVGNFENLHQVMIRMEEAKLGFQLLLQVRNRFLEAYQEVLRMQV